jgi:hypothetical protein
VQAHDFADAKAKTCRNQNHGVVRLGQVLQKEADLAGFWRAVSIDAAALWTTAGSPGTAGRERWRI